MYRQDKQLHQLMPDQDPTMKGNKALKKIYKKTTRATSSY